MLDGIRRSAAVTGERAIIAGAAAHKGGSSCSVASGFGIAAVGDIADQPGEPPRFGEWQVMAGSRHHEQPGPVRGSSEAVLVGTEMVAAAVDQPHRALIPAESGERIETVDGADHIGNDLGGYPALRYRGGDPLREYSLEYPVAEPFAAVAPGREEPVGQAERDRHGSAGHTGGTGDHQPRHLFAEFGSRRDSGVTAQRMADEQGAAARLFDGRAHGVDSRGHCERFATARAVSREVDSGHRTFGPHLVGDTDPASAAQPDAVHQNNGNSHETSICYATLRCKLAHFAPQRNVALYRWGMDAVSDGGARPRRAGAIFAATLELLADKGYEGLTMEAVAARAEVNKTTLYRWWKSKDEVLAAALTDSDLLAFTVPDTGSLRGDLVETTRSIHTLLTGPATAPIAAAVLAAAPYRPALAAIGRAFFADRAEREHPIFRRAIDRGELPEDTDPRLIMDMLAGAIWFRLFLRAEDVREADLTTAVDLVLGGAAAH